MALGDTYNNNEKKNYSPSITSGYRFSNPDSTIDKTQLSFTFWNKLLKVSIAPKKETGNDEIAFDHENAGSIYLSHTKALIFYKEICKFLKEYHDGVSVENAGVSIKDGIIYISNGKEFNAEGPCIVLRKIDENGHATSTFVYEFRRGIHSSVINYEEKTAKFESRFYDTIEIEQVANLLKSYYESMTMAIAYSIKEVNKYDDSRINTKLKVIGEKLGVEFGKQNNNSGRTVNNSYFSNANKQSSGNTGYNAPSTSYESGSLDDLD